MSEQVKFWRDPRFVNLDLLHAHYVTHAFSRHIHETFAIGVILQGAEAFAYRGEHHIAPAGCVVVINPGEVHTGYAATEVGWTYRMLYPDVSLLQQAAIAAVEKPANIPYFPQAVIHDADLRRSLLLAHVALEQHTSQLERDSRLLWTLTQLVARHSGTCPSLLAPGQEPLAIRQVRQYLEAQYARNPSLEELGAIANLSPFYLLRTFRQQIGLPPHEYLCQVRLSHAKRLLSEGRAIADVAHLTGFSDQSHLTRQFKRMVGVTPGQYRAQSLPRPSSASSLLF